MIANFSETITAISTRDEKKCLNPINMLLTPSTIPQHEIYRFGHELDLIKNDLLRSELNTYGKIEKNHEFLCLIQDIVDDLCSLPDIIQQKLKVPEFDEVEDLETDTVEIKKYIRKMNTKFLAHYCNHKVSDEKCDMVFKNVSDIYNSKEFVDYKEFINSLSECVWQIRKRDSMSKEWKETEFLPTARRVNEVRDELIKLSGNISKYNAQMNPKCAKCEAAVRSYKYFIKTVERMRKENEEIKKVREDIINNEEIQKPMTVSEFVHEKFNEIERFKLSELKESYKKLYNINKTYDQLKSVLEATGEYKVTNCQRVFWATKL